MIYETLKEFEAISDLHPKAVVLVDVELRVCTDYWLRYADMTDYQFEGLYDCQKRLQEKATRVKRNAITRRHTRQQEDRAKSLGSQGDNGTLGSRRVL
jgi:hypothetical protein